jgi:hypothetical protein
VLRINSRIVTDVKADYVGEYPKVSANGVKACHDCQERQESPGQRHAEREKVRPLSPAFSLSV